jgi:eukaryotic-like serine/threonine-protein kinase
MTQNPTKSGSSVPGGAGSQAGFPKSAVSFDGPETVINPERRGSGSAPGAVPRSTGSSIWTRLFPNEAAAGPEFAAGAIDCRLGHFLIEAMIGAGGMGAVFRAVDERLDRVVALKVLSPSLARDQASIHRFVNEARAAARLDHDNIARVFYVGEDQGLHFIAHEFVTGRNIRDLIRTNGPLHPREAVNYTLQIATALRHTAAAGVVHRDIKPSNLIVTPRGRAKLVDLGLAKKVASESFGDLTIAGTTLGTFDYISPEQAKDPRNVDVRSDIYSLGCTLYHMLTGEPPYPEGTVLQKLLDHQAKDVPDPARKNPQLPPRLSAVVRRMMAPDPRDRYATPDDLILDLLPIAAEMGLRGVNPEGLVWTSQPLGTRSFVERNVTWIVAAAALLIVAVLFDRFSERARGLHGTDNPGFALSSNGAAPAQLPGLDPKRIPATNPSARVTEPLGGVERPAHDGAVTKTQSATGTKTGDSAPAGTIASGIASAADKAFSDVPLLPPFQQLVPPVELPLTPSRAEQRPDAKLQPQPQEAAADASKPKSAAVPPAPEISISDGGTTTSYATLEAAVADAKDGSRIELKYNGRRAVSEKPFRVSGRRVTISGKGFHPVISFSPREVPAIGFESRMITLNNGSLELVDVEIQATVPETSASDHWSLVSLGGPDHVRCRGVNITVTNPGNRPAEVVDVSSARDPMADRLSGRQAGPMGSPQEFEIDVKNSFIRGSCNLCTIRTTETGRLDVGQSAIAVQGSLLSNLGDDESPGESRRLTVRLEHVTCFLGGGLIHMDSGDVPNFLIPLQVDARNNIFAASSSGTPLISLAGKTNGDDFARLIRWEGTRNFYDRFANYWAVGSTAAGVSGAGTSNRSLPFEDWKHLLGDTEVESNNGGIVWKETWQSKPSAAIRSSDFALANVNQAVSGATDNTDVGADLTAIRPFSEPPAAPESPQAGTASPRAEIP